MVQVPTSQSTVMAQSLGLGGAGNVLGWLVERFGPTLAEILLQLLTKKSSNAALPQQDPMGIFDVKSIVVVLLERVGPPLIEQAAVALDARGDLMSKLAANVLREYSDQLLAIVVEWLSTPEGVKAFESIVAK